MLRPLCFWGRSVAIPRGLKPVPLKNYRQKPVAAERDNRVMEIRGDDVLIVVDVQNDFCPGGALAVPRGDEVIRPILRAAERFEHVVVTQDWHPAGHRSFATAHAGRKPLETVEMPYGEQVLWPEHCVQGTWGAELHPELALQQAQLILRKGFRADVDSYSAFFENDRRTETGLAGYLRERGLKRAFFAGLAYDFCVGFSALDARRLGLEAVVLREACRAIDVEGSVKAMELRLREVGAVEAAL